MKFYHKKNFKKLQKEWYDKLKDEGFEDIECVKPGLQDSDYLKGNADYLRKKYKKSTEEHFRRCRIHLNHHDWTGDVEDYHIFLWYTEGKSYRHIIRLLKQHLDIKKSTHGIFGRVKKILKQMYQERHWENTE